jgi:two-component system cell cycle response regulator
MSTDDQDTAVSDVSRAVPVRGASDCLVVLYRRNGDAGKPIKLEGSPINIGRDPANQIVLGDDENISRQHCRLERREDRLLIMDVGSTNRTLLNDCELTTIAELKTGDTIKIGSTILKYLSGVDMEASVYEQIYTNTITDGLTGLKNKRYLGENLPREFSRARRHKRALSVLMIDIDHFKKVNDEHGHLTGDAVLKVVAAKISSCVRSEDIVARWGGEEIVVMLLESDLQAAAETAERIRSAVEVDVIATRGANVKVTVSIGCAAMVDSDKDEHSLVARADDRAYVAKRSGRNNVKC